MRSGFARPGAPPLLPPGATRPTWAGRPLDFLALIDFAEIAGVLSLPDLPATGAAYFYYAAEIPRPWGDDPAERDGWRVLSENLASGTPDSGTPGSETSAYGTPGSETPAYGTPGFGTPASGTPGSGRPGSGRPGSGTPGSGTPASDTPGSGTPGDTHAGGWDGLGAGTGEAPAVPLAAEPFLSLPGPCEPSLRALDATWSGFLDVYEQLYEAWLRFAWADLPRHQLAGWPVLVQRSLGEDQRLLLQIDSDERLGRYWGDPGTVYFHARAADLSRGALERCRLTLQAR